VTLNGDPIAQHATQDDALELDRTASVVVAASSSTTIGSYQVLLTRSKFTATPFTGTAGKTFSASLKMGPYDPGSYSVSVVTREALGCLQTGFVDVGSSSSGLAGKALLGLLGLAVLLGGRVAYVAFRRRRKRKPKGKHRLTQ
jgi:hypothetical protein